MLKAARFTIRVIHPRVGRHLKRLEKRIQRKFWDALDHTCEGPFPVDDPLHIAHLKGPFHVHTATR